MYNMKYKKYPKYGKKKSVPKRKLHPALVVQYYTKEVLLLPTASENHVIRGGKQKQILMENGFVLSEICIVKNWSGSSGNK